MYIYLNIYIYIYIYIRRASGPRRGEIKKNNIQHRGLPPPIILPLGGPGTARLRIVE